MVRTLFGGRGPHHGVLLPGECVAGYETVACGTASTISPKEGEIAFRVARGDATCFSRWAIGPRDEIVAAYPAAAAALAERGA